MGSMILADGTPKKAAPAPIIALAAAIFGLLFFYARFGQAVGSRWDRDLLLWLNSFAASHRYVWELANNALFKGFPVFFSLVALWFDDDSKGRRSRMLVGFLATCVAIGLSLWMQFHLATHTRPLLDLAIPLNIVEPRWILDWDRRGSFPSDTATMYFALATVNLLGKSIGRAVLPSLGRRDHSSTTGHLWVALSDRHRWLSGLGTGMRSSLQHRCIPADAV